MTARPIARRLGAAALLALITGLGLGGTAQAQDVPPIPSVPSVPSVRGGIGAHQDSGPVSGQQYLPLPGGGSLSQTPGGGQHIDLGS